MIPFRVYRATWRRWPLSIAAPEDRSLLELTLQLPLPPELRVKLEEPSSMTRRMLEMLNDSRVVEGYNQELLIQTYLHTLGIEVTFLEGRKG